jgi:hypothetical protein
MTMGDDIADRIERRLREIQRKHNFNPKLGKKQIRNRPDQQYDYGRFVSLREMSELLDIPIPYDPSGSGQAKRYVFSASQRYVYFINQVGTSIWKIGSSFNPYARLNMIRVGNPHPLHLKYRVLGGLREEKTVQLALDEYHMRGEWFDVDEEVIKAVVKELEHGHK